MVALGCASKLRSNINHAMNCAENANRTCCILLAPLLLLLLLLKQYNYYLIKIDVYLIIARQKFDSLIYFHSVHVHLRHSSYPSLLQNSYYLLRIDWPQVMLCFENLIIETEYNVMQ